jgi:hypothetical protein
VSAVLTTRRAPAPVPAAGPVRQVRVIRAEWTKLRALRSTWWCALIAVVLIAGLSAAIAGSGAPYQISAADPAAGGVTITLAGVLFAQLMLAMAGVLAFSGEYAIGMIRATLAAVPSRLPVLWAKLTVLAGLMLPVTLLAAVAGFFTATALESSRGGSAISLASSTAREALAETRRRSASCGPRAGWNYGSALPGEPVHPTAATASTTPSQAYPIRRADFLQASRPALSYVKPPAAVTRRWRRLRSQNQVRHARRQARSSGTQINTAHK